MIMICADICQDDASDGDDNDQAIRQSDHDHDVHFVDMCEVNRSWLL